jgi:hypothetical protein
VTSPKLDPVHKPTDDNAFVKDSKNEPGKMTLLPPKTGPVVIPKKLSPAEQREFMRNEYKRLSKNLEDVQYDKLDAESKYNYIICRPF